MNTESKNKSEKNSINYNLPKSLIAVLPILGIFFLIFGFALNFNITEKVKSLVNKNLIINKNCKGDFNEFDSELFTLGYNMKGFLPQGKCNPNLSLLKSIYIGLRGISFTPLGLRFKSIINLDKLAPIELILSLGVSNFEVMLTNQKISITQLLTMVNSPISLKGDSIIDAVVHGKYSNLEGGDISIKSEKLTVNEQEIQNFIIPQLNLQKNVINFKLTKKDTIKINSLSLGSAQDIVELLAQGEISGYTNLLKSQLKIEGKFNFKNEFSEKIPLLNLLLNGKKKKQGYYQFELSGNLGSPKFNIK